VECFLQDLGPTVRQVCGTKTVFSKHANENGDGERFDSTPSRRSYQLAQSCLTRRVYTTLSSFRQIQSPLVTFCYSAPRLAVNDVTAADYSSCHLDHTHRHDRRPLPLGCCRPFRPNGRAHVVTYGNAKREIDGIGARGSGEGRAATAVESSVTCNAIVGVQCPMSN